LQQLAVEQFAQPIEATTLGLEQQNRVVQGVAIPGSSTISAAVFASQTFCQP
jgi:hypothetical protein